MLGEKVFYSMGISVYTCFAMIAIYLLLTIAYVTRQWQFIESHKRVNMMTMNLIGACVNQENPVMKELTRYHDEMVMGFAT